MKKIKRSSKTDIAEKNKLDDPTLADDSTENNIDDSLLVAPARKNTQETINKNMDGTETDSENELETTSKSTKPKKKKVIRKKANKKTVNTPKNPVVQPDKQSVKMRIILLSVMIVFLMGSAMAVIRQVSFYRSSFTYSKQLRKQEAKLNTEWHRLLLEQQTFGATTKIGGRAVSTMSMYSPKPSNVITINMANKDQSKK